MNISAGYPRPTLSGIEHHSIELGDGSLHLAATGEGPAVLLLHGFGQTWWQWHKLMPALADAGHRVYAPDLRGEGHSNLPTARMRRTARRDDVLALMDCLQIHRAVVIGHDLNAITTYQLAFDHPDRVRAAVLLSVPPPQMRFEPAMLKGMRLLWHQETLAIPGVGRWLMSSGIVPRYFLSHRFWANPIDEQLRDNYLMFMTDAAFALHAERLCRNIVLPELFRIMRGDYRNEKFAMPTLCVFGAEDAAFPPKIITKVFAHPKEFGSDVRLAMIEGTGHFNIDERPEETGGVIVDFCREATRR